MSTKTPGGRTGLQTAERSGEDVRSTLRRLGQSGGALHRADALSVAASSRRMFAAVLATACTRHGARAGQPCWTLPSGVRLSHDHAGLCGSRVAVVVSQQTGARGRGSARAARGNGARR